MLQASVVTYVDFNLSGYTHSIVEVPTPVYSTTEQRYGYHLLLQVT